MNDTLPIGTTTVADVPVWRVEREGSPLAVVDILVAGAGHAAAPDRNPAVPLLAAALIDAGTERRDRAAVRRALLDATAEVGAETQDTWFHLHVSAPASSIGTAVDLAAEALREFAPAKEDFGREKAALVESRHRAMAEAGGRADALYRATAGSGTPAGIPVPPPPETVAAVRYGDVVGFVRPLLRRLRLHVVTVHPPGCGARIDDALARMLAVAPHGRRHRPAPMPPFREIVAAWHDGHDPQCAMAFGGPGIPATDDGRAAWSMVLDVLGGHHLESRLTRALRVERGLTYGVALVAKGWRARMDWRGGAVLRAGTAKLAMDTVRGVIERLPDDLGPADVVAARTRLTAAWEEATVSNTALATLLCRSVRLGDAPQSVATLPRRLCEVDLDRMREQAARLAAMPVSFVFAGDVGEPFARRGDRGDAGTGATAASGATERES